MDKEFLFQKYDVSKKGARSSEFRNAFAKIKDSVLLMSRQAIILFLFLQPVHPVLEKQG